MDIKTLSASAYDTYDRCEFQWFMCYNLKIRDASGPAAFMGTIAHHALEVLGKASMINKDRNSKTCDIDFVLNAVFNRYATRNPLEMEQLKEDKIRKICKGVYHFLETSYSPLKRNVIGVEKYFKMEYPDLKTDNGPLLVRGYIDRVDQIDDETIEIIDYKSGARKDFGSDSNEKLSSSTLYKKIQPRLYYNAAKKLYPWAKNILTTFIYFTDGGSVVIPFCNDDIKKTDNMVRKRFYEIKNNENPQKNRSWRCKKFCWYGKTGYCDRLWTEKEQNDLKSLVKKHDK